MVGEGVLYECLQHNDVEEVLVIGRRSCGYTHPKLKEIVHADMYNLSSIEDQLEDYAKRKNLSLEEAEKWLRPNLDF